MSCALCGSDQLEVVSEVDAKSRKPLTVSQCTACGLVQQSPMPTDEELRQYYEHEYRLDYKSVYTPRPQQILRAGRLALNRLAFLQSSGSSPQGSVLDIGAGGGEFLYICSQQGLPAVKGIEPNIGYSSYAREELGVDIQQGQLEQLTGKYDIITMFHVFEHLLSPVAVFEKLYELINPGGWLLIEVPWIESRSQSPSNTYFKAHTLYFSESSLTACASPYFVSEVVNTEDDNLKILFRPRAEPVGLQLPAAGTVQQAVSRVKNKGWVQYLTTGNGLMKPFNKLARISSESRVKRMKGRQILDDLLQDQSKKYRKAG